MDDFNDLVELGIDDELTINFNHASSHIQSVASTLDNDHLLTLYAYYKQATVGTCTTAKPGWFDFKAKAKWEAWKDLCDMSKDEAKEKYINTVKSIDANYSNASQVKEGWVTVSTLQKPSADSDVPTTLTDFVKNGDCEKVTETLKGILPDELNQLDEDGLGVIHWAADRGVSSILKMLINSGVDVNLKDCEGQTALHYAASCGHIDCLQVLLNEGADISATDDEGNDCISVATDDHVNVFFDNYLKSSK